MQAPLVHLLSLHVEPFMRGDDERPAMFVLFLLPLAVSPGWHTHHDTHSCLLPPTWVHSA